MSFLRSVVADARPRRPARAEGAPAGSAGGARESQAHVLGSIAAPEPQAARAPHGDLHERASADAFRAAPIQTAAARAAGTEDSAADVVTDTLDAFANTSRATHSSSILAGET